MKMATIDVLDVMSATSLNLMTKEDVYLVLVLVNIAHNAVLMAVQAVTRLQMDMKSTTMDTVQLKIIVGTMIFRIENA